MRFIHTADWQIGKPFRQFGEKESVLKQARLDAIEAIGRLAVKEGAPHVLVAGDIYDSEAPAQSSLLEPMERMRTYSHVTWHLLPGNHDPHRPQGLWHRVKQAGPPGNVRLHLSPQPCELSTDAVLLPAPLTRKSESNDLTDWMDRAETAPGRIRIGLAHGAVVGFGTGGEASNPIDRRRVQSAGLDYLALGDWHRTMEVGRGCWYAGTPEPDRAGSQETGQVMLVDIQGPGTGVEAKPVPVGTFRWTSMSEQISNLDEFADLETRLRGLPDLSRLILRLAITGALPLAVRVEVEHRLAGLRAAMFRLDDELDGLAARPSAEDLEQIDFDGVLRHSADRLKLMSEDQALSPAERQRAQEALVQLFLLTREQA